ncbi:epoxyqueuosine reductase [Thermodesulfobacteriota bacterium]
MKSQEIKQAAFDLGGDLCGIADVNRFEGAPEGFHPRDVFSECKSVVVLACRFLVSTLYCRSTIPYTDVRNELTRKMDRMAIRLSYVLESNSIKSVPINSIGPCEWDEKAKKSRGIISLKHAAVCAGLGKIGKNTLLINEKYGNMIWLSAVLVSQPFNPDPLIKKDICPDKCRLCLDACPVSAMDGVSIDQKKCWEHAFGTHKGGEWRIKCFECRKVCPQCLGSEMKALYS